MLEHCPDCKHEGKCDGEVRCLCGCTEAEHDFTHEKSHYPERRHVEHWQACEAHNCGSFRPKPNPFPEALAAPARE